MANTRETAQRERLLVIVADDFGVGPATTQGILDLAEMGRVSGSVLLVNSPYAELGVKAWRQQGQRLELGWHPCLTLDRPISDPKTIPSIVQENGSFLSLGQLLKRLMARKVRREDVLREWTAQYDRFCELVGTPPSLVNSHHHVQIFQPIGDVLLEILRGAGNVPYVRRVREPWQMLVKAPGARAKRAFLSYIGRGQARALEQGGLPGNDWLAGVTDPACLVGDPDFLARWIRRMPGETVELTCHPGLYDTTLLGREGTDEADQLDRRVREFDMLRSEGFGVACRRAGFRIVAPSELAARAIR